MPLVTATFSTGGNVTINDTVEVAAINALTAALNEFSRLSVNQVGTPAANLAVMASSLNDISSMLSTMLKQQKAINQSLGLITASMSNLSNNVSSGVTTAQMAYIDQVKANEFDQQQANAALERAGIPPLKVPPGDFVEKAKANIVDVANLNVQQDAINLVQSGINRAQDLTLQSVTWLIEKGWSLTPGPQLLEAIQEKLGLLDAKSKSKQAIAETNSSVRAVQTGLAKGSSPLPTTI